MTRNRAIIRKEYSERMGMRMAGSTIVRRGSSFGFFVIDVEVHGAAYLPQPSHLHTEEPHTLLSSSDLFLKLAPAKSRYFLFMIKNNLLNNKPIT